MKVLFTPYSGGSIAHIVRSFVVADELKRRGHEILFKCSTTKRNFVQQAGYDVFGNGHPEVNFNDEKDQSIAYIKANHCQILAWLKDELMAAEQFKPDIIVNSPNFMGTPAGSKFKIPFVSIINAQWLPEFRGLLGLGISKNHIGHRVIRQLVKPIFAQRFEKTYMGEVSAFYREMNIPAVPTRHADIHGGNPAIIPGVPQFEPLVTGGRTDLHYVGPLFWQGFERQDFDTSSYFSDCSSSRPFIYVSLGGSIFRKRTYDDLIAACAKRTNWNILLSLGPNFSRDDFATDMPHFAIRPYVPGVKACQFADVVVNTGSHGTVMQALWSGKPVIAVPHNIDQGSIAARLVELKIGVNLNPVGLKDFTDRDAYFKKATQISWATIMDEIEKLLKNGRLRRNAEVFGTTLRRYPFADVKAADIIENYVMAGKV